MIFTQEMASNTFFVRFNKSNIEVSKEKAKDTQPEKQQETTFATSIQHDGNKYIVSSNRFTSFDDELSTIADRINNMQLKHSDTDNIFDSCSALIKSYTDACIQSVNSAQSIENKKNICSILLNVNEHAKNKLLHFCTRYRRDKELEQNKLYVEPVPKSIGSKWKTKRNHVTDLQDHSVVDSTLQYIPIAETLKKLFMDEQFKQLYFKFNDGKHECVDGTSKGFCCGSVCKKFDIYRDKYTIQLQIATDDYDVCDALGSKKVKHKICAVYFRILNLPNEINSKLRNIFLIVLCNTAYLNNKENKYDKVSEIIVPELQRLESVGIDIGNNKRLKVVYIARQSRW